MKTKLLFLLLLTAIVANSQTRQPFSNIGKKVKVVTLTDGKYDEFFDENPLQRVGSSVINVKTRKLTKVEISQAEIDELENAQASRFLSVDPLTNKFAMLSPYQYASNSPIENIDLDGLEAFSVHGTNQGNGLFQNNKGAVYTSETKKELLRITGNKALDENFKWNAPIWNRKSMERKVAAYQLAKHVIQTRAKMMNKGIITESEPISLIGYSHGGNVSIQAAKIINDILGVKVNIVTVATPAYNSVFTDAEDPAGNKGINAHTHIIHENDDVWFIAGGLPSYPTADNYFIQNSEIPFKNGIEAHTDLPESPKLAGVLKKIPEMKKAPVPQKINEIIKNGKKVNKKTN